MPVNLTRPTHASPNPEARLYLKEDELDRTIELLMAAARQFWTAAARPLAIHGLGPAHYRALAGIRRAEGQPISALQAKLGVRKQSLARVLDDLESKGLIRREPSPIDRRARRLALTEAGRLIETEISSALRERLGVIFRACGAEAVGGARDVLAMLAAWRDADDPEDQEDQTPA